MSGTGWQWRDPGSGPGRIQRAVANVTYSRSQDAYRAYLEHAAECGDCAPGEGRCVAGDGLWRSYQAARRGA